MAFGLVVAAGLSTAIGAAAVFERRVVRLASKPVLAAGLGFSGGVMIYVSFVEIFGKSVEAFGADGTEERVAYYSATICLFAGMVLLRLISFLVHRLDGGHHHGADAVDLAQQRSVSVPPLVVNAEAPQAPPQVQSPAADVEAPTDAGKTEEAEAQEAAKPAEGAAKKSEQDSQLQMMGLNTAAAIAIHNFPEGLATFVATLAEPSVGVTLAIAIAIHNIPEGLCVALPIYYATDSRMKGFLWALLSGLSEPIGAFIGWLIIKSTGEDMSQVVYGILFGMVAGMMIMIVILELLPTAYRYDPKDKFVTNSVVSGMFVMAISLCMFMA